jgi:hypothetical protein
MSVPRLPVARPDGKRESERKARRRAHAEAFVTATGRITAAVMDEVGKPGMRLLEEIGSGAKRGPAELLEQIVEVAREHKPEADAAAPLRVLARRLGYDLVPLAAVEPDGVADVVGACADVGKETSDVLAACLELARRPFLTPAMRDRARREIPEAFAALHRLAGEVEELSRPPGERAALAAGNGAVQ